MPAWAFANNPCIMDAYTADATPLWVNNTMYLYCSHDANFVTGQTGYNIPNDVLISSTDLVNWEDEGVIVTNGVGNPWAPAVVYLNGTYYLYYTAGGGAVGVLTSTSPNGPFAGGNQSLVTGATSDPGMGGNLLDPAAFVDTTGQAYLYFGGGGPGSGAGNCSRVIKLNANMTSVNGSGSGVPAPNFFEASGINVRNGIYYYSYSSDPAFGMNIEYIMANNPLFTNPTIPAQPIVVANGGAGNCYNNQGGGLVNIGNTWYVAYFNRALAIANGLACAQGAYQRSVCFDQLNFNADGTIQEATQTTLGPTALHNVNPFVTQRAASMAAQGGVAPAGLSEKGVQTEACSEGDRDLTDIAPTDWIEVRNLDFGSCASAFTARVAATAGGGVIQIHRDSQTGTLLGTCNIPATGGTQTWANVSCPVTGATGLHDVYFVFSGTTFNFQSYSFTTCGSPTPSPSASASATASPTLTPSPTASRTPSPIPTAGPCQYIAAVACGSTAAYTSTHLGLTFGADQQYTPGSAPGAAGSYGYVSWAAGTAYASTATIIGGDAIDAALYNNQRYATTLGYDFSVPNGQAYVTLYWAETYATAPGQRVMSLTINGSTVAANLDLYVVAGANATYISIFPVTVTNGVLSLVATASVNNAEFQGISVQAGPPCTPSPTHSPTWTVSPTRTATPSASATATATPTATRTHSPTGTASPTATPTQSPSATPSGSPSATALPTATPTQSTTPLASATATPTPHPSASVTGSPSASTSPSPQPSATATSQDTATLSSTPQSTATATPQATATLSSTATASATVSPAETATATPSLASSASPSATMTPSATVTASATVTVTATVSATATATVTTTATMAAPTATVTVTANPSTATPSPTVDTANPSSPDTLSIFKVVAVPNPQGGDQLRLAVQVQGPADTLELRLYTVAMVLVASGKTPGGSGWVTAVLPLPPLPGGVYYAVVTARRGIQRYQAPATRVMRLY